ncbi:MAG: carbamoyltransferase HypF, partial [Saprospiraceae bacterium]|nr:carbamoyltransferase HypF [Saprospiraceae bacterium]
KKYALLSFMNSIFMCSDHIYDTIHNKVRMIFNLKTWHIHITGQVQGIGYRPYIYRKAKDHDLKGWVSNDAAGVHIQVNANKKSFDLFIDDIALIAPPPLAVISSIQFKEIEFQSFNQFEIIHLGGVKPSDMLITPDFAICPECRKEIEDENDRRINYSFTTCCQCGPRYSVTNSLPYDRENTEMATFQMCHQCSSEYNKPADRRYFSQTNSCSECGVSMSLYNSEKKLLSSEDQAITDNIINFWNKGKIIAIKGIGGYLLTCDAQNEEVVSRLRKLKNRPSKPFAVMIPSLDHVSDLTNVERSSFMGSISPIVLLDTRKVKGEYHGIHDGLDKVGVMIPYAPLFQILLNLFQKPIVATSGNVSNSPIIYKNDEALDQLSQIADYIVTNNREIAIPQDDSIIQYTEVCQQKIIIRRSRGLAPTYFNSKNQWKGDGVLAMGAHLKSTFSILHNQNVYISQYLGDLDHYDTLQHYRHTLDHLSQLLNTKVSQVIVDHHPEYTASIDGKEMAQSQNLPLLTVQHHIAHFCALLGEHALQKSNEKILGVIWDGTGLGDDRQVWGSEFFTYEKGQFDRCANLEYYPTIGSDKMAREPRLSALAILGESEVSEDVLRAKFSTTESKIYHQLLKRSTTIKSTSMGRLFDAVSSLLGIKDILSYEGEAAMLLEMQARTFFKSNN